MGQATGDSENGLAVRTETALRRVAAGCAIFMFFGPVGGRTTWVQGHTTVIDAAGYNMAALLSGVAALVAIAAFGLTVAASGIYVLARMQGEVWYYGTGGFADMGEKWTLYPDPGPPFFALAALIGAPASHALAILWLRRPQGDPSRLVPFG